MIIKLRHHTLLITNNSNCLVFDDNADCLPDFQTKTRFLSIFGQFWRKWWWTLDIMKWWYLPSHGKFCAHLLICPIHVNRKFQNWFLCADHQKRTTDLRNASALVPSSFCAVYTLLLYTKPTLIIWIRYSRRMFVTAIMIIKGFFHST